MRLSKILPVLLLTFTLGSIGTFAQKVGHMNSDALMSQMQEVKNADQQIQAYQKQKEKQMQEKYEKINKFMAEAMKAEQEGTLSRVQLEQKQTELQKMEADLRKAEAEAKQSIVQKQEELLQPIMDKINDAIQLVGKTNNYDYIFNTSSGVLLHADKGDDVTALVKKELGL